MYPQTLCSHCVPFPVYPNLLILLFAVLSCSIREAFQTLVLFCFPQFQMYFFSLLSWKLFSRLWDCRSTLCLLFSTWCHFLWVPMVSDDIICIVSPLKATAFVGCFQYFFISTIVVWAWRVRTTGCWVMLGTLYLLHSACRWLLHVGGVLSFLNYTSVSFLFDFDDRSWAKISRAPEGLFIFHLSLSVLCLWPSG